MAALRSCLEPRCAALVEKGRCATHARTYDLRRGSFRERGYSAKWDTAAKAFRSQYPLCGMRPNGLPPVMSECHDMGRTTLGFQTDHVVPHKGDQSLFWDALGNWQVLCAACGARKSKAGL